MVLVLGALRFAVYLFLLALLARMIISWVMVFSRDWRPRGAMLVVVESVFTVTDPPLKALRSLVPPLRLGGVQLDLAFMLLFLGCLIVDGVIAAMIVALG
ncbi:YggT family protein [Demequina sp. B12]|uniref:YggT family protein n=1 Tax=Demequina sp. B12 TaxID=2992757 RepID=UPI00237BEC54|nr:YggT family protein [Demequina sp. B12]MDE0573321.1 YggT family protein [Demequina sp. B12]